MRAEFAREIIAVAGANRQVLFLTGDLGYMALEPVQKALGDRFINAGVAEQNMTSVAAGLAREGFIPWVYSIAPFAVLRPYEHIRNDVCLHNLPVKIVGNGGGFGYGIMGATHHTLEDIGAMRVLPNMRVYVPVVSTDVGEALRSMVADPHPNYIRLNYAVKTTLPLPSFRQWRKLKEGNRAVLISVGPVVGHVLGIADRDLLDEIEVWDIGILPAMDMPQELIDSVREKRIVITMEEHYGQCGMNECIARLLLEVLDCPITFRPLYARGYPSGRYGSQRWHLEENGLAGEPLVSLLKGALHG